MKTSKAGNTKKKLVKVFMLLCSYDDRYAAFTIKKKGVVIV